MKRLIAILQYELKNNLETSVGKNLHIHTLIQIRTRMPSAAATLLCIRKESKCSETKKTKRRSEVIIALRETFN